MSSFADQPTPDQSRSFSRVKLIALMYHDVVEHGEWESSGFPGAHAARFKLERQEFVSHMQAISGAISTPPSTLDEVLAGTASRMPFLITFDDGGGSAAAVADLLEQYGWHAHFFVTTNYIGTSSFLNERQIRDLRRRGHVIGSHSRSHPQRISSLAWEQILDEWNVSTRVLSEVLDEKVRYASVPGGFYSSAVARAAAAAGIAALFTSEPTQHCHMVDGCLVVGRYHLVRGMSAQSAAALACGRMIPCVAQSVLWNLRKAAKSIGGEHYVDLRNFLLSKRDKPRN